MKIVVLIITGLFFFSCGQSSSEIEVIEDKSVIPAIPDEIKKYSFNNIEKIHQYVNIDRWNSGGDIGMRTGTNYEGLAASLRIPTSKVKAIDQFYNYEVIPALEEKIKRHLAGNPDYIIDMYHPIQPTAYCGINTFHGQIIVKGDFDDEEVKVRSEILAQRLKSTLPEWVTGFKITDIKFINPLLEIEKSVDIGYLWVRGNKLRIMKSGTGTYGYYSPEINRFWQTREWFDQKSIPIPTN
jgi:hypothetical protein